MKLLMDPSISFVRLVESNLFWLFLAFLVVIFIISSIFSQIKKRSQKKDEQQYQQYVDSYRKYCAACGEKLSFGSLLCPKCGSYGKSDSLIPKKSSAPTAPKPNINSSTTVSPPVSESDANDSSTVFDLPSSSPDYSYNDVAIAGHQFHDLSGISVGYNVNLVFEPENEHDSRAVAFYCLNKKIGYINKGRLQDMCHDFLNKEGRSVSAKISNIDPDNPTVRLDFYKFNISKGKNCDDTYESFKGQPGGKTFKLTSNLNEEMQENLSFVSEGDEVDIDYYDDEKEKYLASVDGSEIGYFPKSANDLLEDDCKAFVISIEENDDDKYIAYVKVFPF